MTESEEEKIRKSKELFEKKSTLVPARGVVMPEGKGTRTLEESEDDTTQDSDLKAVMRRLFPKFPVHLIDKVVSAVMVGRILHETMLDRIQLTVQEIVECWENEEEDDIDVMMIINMVTTAFEIGVDSQGRVDIVEVHGAKSSEELEKMADYMRMPQ